MSSETLFGLFGAPLPELATVPADAVQLSPLMPGARVLEDVAEASLTGLVMTAPPGTLERRYALALGLRALKPGAALTAMAPKEKGGNRIANELESFGCDAQTESRRHQRITKTVRPESLSAEAEAAIASALAAGGPCFVENLSLWSQPGVFSWDRIDPGTALLLSVLPSFAGRGADLGCGIGVIARAVLASASVSRIELIDIDRRAITAARQNITDSRAAFHWADVRRLSDMDNLDFVVMNPPFHDGGLEDRALGASFVRECHRILRAGGTAWLVANRHLPYESVLSVFSQTGLRAERDGYKVYEATK